MDERHHIDVNNWVCSCPAYLNSRYLLCKHLVSKKNGKEFLPTFLETARHHDYPFLVFNGNKLPSITPANNPWSRYRIMEEINTTTTNIQDVIMITEATENILANRHEYLAKLKTKFDSALKLYEREIDNDNFVSNFEDLMKPIIKEIDGCEKALHSHNQQSTWQQRSGKLAFYLH
jgi:glutamine synthetase type III